MAYFLTQDTSAVYTRFGGSSAKYHLAVADGGLVTEDISITPTESSPYFSAFIIVWNESDDGLKFFVEWDNATTTFTSPVATTNVKNQWVQLMIEGLELPTDADTARLKVLSVSTASLPWWLDAAMLVQAGTIGQFFEGRVGTVLWQRAVRETRTRSSPSISYNLEAKDLTAVNATEFPHDALTLGGNMKIVDRELGLNETLRVTRLTRDLLKGADVEIDVESTSIWQPGGLKI